MTAGSVAEVGERLRRALEARRPGLLAAFPIPAYRRLLDRYPRYTAYRHVSRGVRRLCEDVRRVAGAEGLETYHRLLLAELIADAPERLAGRELPDGVRERFGRNLMRILAALEEEAEPGAYTHASDRFSKDLGVANLTLLPAGAQKIHLDRLPVRVLSRSPAAGARLLAEVGGLAPLYQEHTDSNDPDLMAEFSPEGWERFYRTTAELLRLQPEVRGLFGSSWFFDPALEEISPRLVYLRTLVTDHGGRLLRIGPSAQSTHDATLTSPTRRRLCAEGRYRPESYLLAWPRRALLAWAAATRRGRTP